jgi:hypothetical protein
MVTQLVRRRDPRMGGFEHCLSFAEAGTHERRRIRRYGPPRVLDGRRILASLKCDL